MLSKLLVKDFFENNKNICAFFAVESRDVGIHSHEFWEISYIYEGSGTHYTSTDKTTVNAGEFVFLSPDAQHSLVSPQKNEGSWLRVCNILIRPDYFESILKKYCSISGTESYAFRKILDKQFCLKLKDSENLIYNMIISIAHEYNYPDNLSDKFTENALLNLILYITRIYEMSFYPPPPKNENIKDAIIDNLIKYMKSNYSSQMNLEYLAAYTHFSREYLSRCFKQYTGKTIFNFLTEIRIERAKTLLRSTVYPISDISEYCGYPSINNFQRVFKKMTLMSPSEYRKKSSETEFSQ